MHNIWVIAKREYKLFFISPIAYGLLFVTLLTLGGFLFLDILYATQSQAFVPSIQRTFQLFIFPLLFLSVPAITMRTLAEENRAGTLELLLTAPVTAWELVFGKWLGTFLFFVTSIALTLVYPLILNSVVDPGIDQGVLISGYIGLILITAAMSAIGVLVSSFFRNQVAALLVTFGVIIFFWVIGSPAQLVDGAAADVLRYLSLTEHFYDSFLIGLVRIQDVVYYLSMTAIALFLGSISVEARRWR